MTALEERPAIDSTWWDEVRRAPQTPLRSLVEGFGEIADHPIPFGWLPPRAHLLCEDCRTWADLGEETLDSLRARPLFGPRLVQAVVAAARDDVAEARRTWPIGAGPAEDAQRLLRRLPEEDRRLLLARRWGVRPESIVATAARLEQSNVWRATSRAERRFADLLASPSHAALIEHARELRERLGILTEETAAREALDELGVDPGSVAGVMLLHLAGPYVVRSEWLERAGTEGLATATGALDAALEAHGAPSTAEVLAALAECGVTASSARRLLARRTGLRRHGQRWVRWGDTAADRIEAALHLAGTPSTPSALAAAIGEGYTDLAVRQALYDDRRFIRASKLRWALQRWPIQEYRGLHDEIAARIDAAGGAASTRGIVAEVKAAFPDVAEDSIKVFFYAADFVVDEGMVRHRTAAHPWPAVPALNSVRGTYRAGPQRVRVAVSVGGDVLRGSAQKLSPSVAAALGVGPGERRRFAGVTGDVTVHWQMTTTYGVLLGTLRPIAMALGAAAGDVLVLAFDGPAATVGVSRLPAAAPPRRRLAALLGVAEPRAGDLARALDCSIDELPALLARRGEPELLAGAAT